MNTSISFCAQLMYVIEYLLVQKNFKKLYEKDTFLPIMLFLHVLWLFIHLNEREKMYQNCYAKHIF